MAVNCYFDSEKDLIFAEMTQEVTIKEVKEIAEKVGKLIKKHDCLHVLDDVRNAEFNIDIFEVYKIPKMVIEVGLPFATKRALLVKAKKDFEFYELASNNQFHRVKVFTNKNEAIDWLQR